MAENKKISAMTALETPTGEELVPVAYNGQNYKVKINKLITNGYVFAGFVEPDSTYVSTTAKVFYVAKTEGTYPNFGNTVVGSNEIVFIKQNGIGNISTDSVSILLPSGLESTTGSSEVKAMSQAAITQELENKLQIRRIVLSNSETVVDDLNSALDSLTIPNSSSLNKGFIQIDACGMIINVWNHPISYSRQQSVMEVSGAIKKHTNNEFRLNLGSDCRTITRSHSEEGWQSWQDPVYDLAEEKTRAEAAEKSNRDAIAEEVTRATEAEGNLSRSIAAKADLVDGKVPASQLPSYVDDVVEYVTKAEFPVTGEEGKLYVDTSENKMYRWSGSQYIDLGGALSELPKADLNQLGLVGFYRGTDVNVTDGILGGATSCDQYRNPDTTSGKYGAGLVWFEANVQHNNIGKLSLANGTYDGLMSAEDYKKLRIGTGNESFGGLTVDEPSGKLKINVGNGLLIDNERVTLNLGDAPLFGTGGNNSLTINVGSSLGVGYDSNSGTSKLGLRLGTSYGNNPLTVTEGGLELRYGSLLTVDSEGKLDVVYGSGLTRMSGGLSVQFGTTLEVLGAGADLNVKLHKSTTYPNGKGISNAGGYGLGIELSHTSGSNNSGLDFDENGALKINAGAGITISRNKSSILPDGLNVRLGTGLCYTDVDRSDPENPKINPNSPIGLTLGSAGAFGQVLESKTLEFTDGGLEVKYGSGLVVKNNGDRLALQVGIGTGLYFGNDGELYTTEGRIFGANDAITQVYSFNMPLVISSRYFYGDEYTINGVKYKTFYPHLNSMGGLEYPNNGGYLSIKLNSTQNYLKTDGNGLSFDPTQLMQAMTQAEYDALEAKDANKLYLITDAADATGVNVE